MKKIILSILFLSLLFTSIVFGQVENVPIENGVYVFLKEMKVKGIISYIKEDDPSLSRFEVMNLLKKISENSDKLSATENKILNKYLVEFSDDMNPEQTTQLFNPQDDFFSDLDEMITDKVKYLYAYQEEDNNIYFEWLGHFYHGQRFKPGKTNNANLYDIGFRIRGTLFNRLGYNLSVIKGGVSGNKEIAEIIEPRLLSNFKWIENSENIGNYDFTYGYLKYHADPVKGMDIFLQLGREDITFGYGYGSKLVLSGDNPTMDFLKFNFDYGILHFTSLHATTTGYFSFDREQRYSKFFALNRLKLSFPNLFDIGIGESIIYSGRGIELAYLTPVSFYKFIEMETQDRDNGNIYFDMQTKFLKNLELQGTFLLDENILSNLGDLDRYTNKTAYQLGAFWYAPFSFDNLSVIVEYTRIRPYVYTHVDIKNNYTAFGANLGHRIGPNADEIMTKLNYNVNEWIRLSFEYRYMREGNNILNDEGNVVENVGGDIALSHPAAVVNETAKFLAGEKLNTTFISTGFRIEPIRDFIFDLSFNYRIADNITKHFKDDISFALLKFTLEY